MKRRASAAICCTAGWLTLASLALAQSELSKQPEPAAQPEPSAKILLPPAVEAPKDTAATPSADTTQLVEAFIAKLDSTTRAIHGSAKNDPALLREGCRGLVSQMLDLEAMAKAANGEIWNQLTEAQRELFRQSFEHRMVRHCVQQFDTYEGESLRLAGVRKAESGSLLATIRVGAPEEGKVVTWRLHNSGAQRWRAIDVITEGRSMVVDARNECAAVLQSVNGDIDALLAVMQKKASE